MGADLLAFIEFDNSSVVVPFTGNSNWWNFVGDIRLVGCKDYAFIGAISGVRNKSDKPPLIPLRGCPPNPPRELKPFEDDPFVGYLSLVEVLQALKHHNISTESLDDSIKNLLEVLKVLTRHCGDERVRLVFAILD